MKILTKGNVYTLDVWTCECGFCNTKVRIYAGDPAVHAKAVCISNVVGIELEWICPVCSEVNCQNNMKHDGMTIDSDKRLCADEAREVLGYSTTYNKPLHSQTGETIGYEIGFFTETDWFQAYEEQRKLLETDD